MTIPKELRERAGSSHACVQQTRAFLKICPTPSHCVPVLVEGHNGLAIGSKAPGLKWLGQDDRTELTAWSACFPDINRSVLGPAHKRRVVWQQSQPPDFSLVTAENPDHVRMAWVAYVP